MDPLTTGRKIRRNFMTYAFMLVQGMRYMTVVFAEKVCKAFLVKAALVRDRSHLPTWAGRADALARRGIWDS